MISATEICDKLGIGIAARSRYIRRFKERYGIEGELGRVPGSRYIRRIYTEAETKIIYRKEKKRLEKNVDALINRKSTEYKDAQKKKFNKKSSNKNMENGFYHRLTEYGGIRVDMR